MLSIRHQRAIQLNRPHSECIRAHTKRTTTHHILYQNVKETKVHCDAPDRKHNKFPSEPAKRDWNIIIANKASRFVIFIY
jgi:hypothetical protein